MNKYYEIRNLSEKVLEFITDKLKYTSIYSEILLNEFKKSKIWTIVPIGLSDTELYEFDYGGKVVHDIRENFSELIYKELIKDERNVWIIEDNNGRTEFSVNDNKIDGITLPFYFRANVFHYIIKNPVTSVCILETLRDGGAYPFLGFITKINKDIENSILENSLSNQDLGVIRDNIAFFVIGAYDEESYIFIDMSSHK